MSDLARRQAAFLAAILDDRAPLPSGWGNSQTAGMAVYRGNYRAALMGALAESYERTARYVGKGPFRQARMNHVIANPPSGWTIDDCGAGFADTCTRFFRNNPEVAELAWLERAMLDLATASDTEPLTPQAFAAASAEFGDAEWSGLRLEFQPRAAARLVHHDLQAMWRALGKEGEPIAAPRLKEPQSCLVWREGERPTFLLVEADHAAAFAAMQEGARYAEMIGALLGAVDAPAPDKVEAAAMRAGAMLGLWLREGIVTGIAA